MRHSSENRTFEIRPIIEQRPFTSAPVRAFFDRWCEANDSLELRVISRKKWERRKKNEMLEKRPDGKRIVFVPDDLRLWEMVGVMEVIDQDTFADRPERAHEAKKKMIALGKTFENAGTYIAQHLDGIEEGKEIAEALAVDFYQYGRSLIQGKRQKTAHIDDIASSPLTPKETEIIDHFLAGDSLYESRRRSAKSPSSQTEQEEFYEAQRQKTLGQFFRVAKKAFILQNDRANTDKQDDQHTKKPWEQRTPVHDALLKRIDRGLAQHIETPRRELRTAIFRRGMDLLARTMPFDKLPKPVKDTYLHWKNGEKTLREALRIDKRKEELDRVRETGDKKQIADMERRIANAIQAVVSAFQYEITKFNPSAMVASQLLNCVGASTLGGALMQEAGLTYLVGDIPKHSILFLVTSDGQIEWRDMLSKSFNGTLTDEMIEGGGENGNPLTVSDILQFSQKPKSGRLTFDIKSSEHREKLRWIKPYERVHITVSEPVHGQQLQILNSAGAALQTLGRIHEAIQAYTEGIGTHPTYPHLYDGLGSALQIADRQTEAIKAYQTALRIDPRDAHAYLGIGNALAALHHRSEAVRAYREAIKLHPEDANAYIGLGATIESPEEAITAYREAIQRDPKNAYSYNGLGNLLVDLGYPTEAIRMYQHAIRLHRKFGYAYVGMGNALIKLERPKEAVIAYQKAIQLDPINAFAHKGLGDALMELERPKEAIRPYQQAIQLDRSDPYTYNGLGNAFADLNRPKEAIGAYETFLSLADETEQDRYWVERAKQIITKLSNGTRHRKRRTY